MRKEQKATIVAMWTALILAISKFIFWIMSWSMVVISSALDSLGDLFVSLINFFAIRKSEQPEDDNHNYWHWKVEWLAALFEWLMIGLAAVSIIKISIEKIITNNLISSADSSIFLMIFVIIITFFLVRYLDKVAKETNNLVIKSDSLHYKTDLFTNAGVIVSLILIKFTWIKIIDPVVSIIFSVYVIYSSIKIIKEWCDMLMDSAIDKEDLEKITTILNSENFKVNSFHDLKTRQSWKNIFIEFHLVFDKEITLFEAHNIWDRVECKIKSLFDKTKNLEILIHLDPYDDSCEKNKCFL